ncbi:MAG: hypothetical protein ACKOQ6_08280 [Bacteroidota bacterium]
MRRKKLSVLIAGLSMLIADVAFAQKAKTHVLNADEAKVVKKDAAIYFNSENYNAALPAYIELKKSAPYNPDYNYRLGICYLMTNSDKSLAIEPLEFASKAKEPKKEVWYYLGMAYMYGLDFDKAVELLTQSKSVSGAKLPKDHVSQDVLIDHCNNAKEIVGNPVDVTFTNLGKTINTVYDEYNPLISADGRQLVFTTRRKGNIGGFIEDLGMYSADVYWSSWKDSVWTKPKGLGGMVNTDWDEECVGISPDGNQLLIYFDNADYYADIGKAILKGKMWQRPEMMAVQMNSKNYEGGATISMDGNTIIFSSIRKEGGLGGSDLYMIRREPSGNWTQPQNLGSDINTKSDDDSPFLSIDGKYLYFASKGWNSMGDFDIFRSEWNESNATWNKPVNLGYPINDPDNNSFFSLSGDGRSLYLSSSRKGGLGERDIYQVTFNDSSTTKRYVLIQGTLTSLNGGKPELTHVTLIDSNGTAVVDYKPGYTTGSFLLYATPGNYTIRLEGYHFDALTEPLEIPEDVYNPIIKNLSVTLSK